MVLPGLPELEVVRTISLFPKLVASGLKSLDIIKAFGVLVSLVPFGMG